MIINHNKEKLINSIIYFLQNTENCKKTKLVKLLYFLDFTHFKDTGRSVTGLSYKAFPLGPYPEKLGKKIDKKNKELLEYFEIDFDGESYEIKPKEEFNPIYFSKREIRLLEGISKEFFKSSASEMIDLTHQENQPWIKTLNKFGSYSKIDYTLILDRNQGNYNEILENIKDRKLIEETFNA